MSVKTLKSFLIGIGYDTKGLEAGEKKISGSLEGLKGRTLQISGALVGAFSAGAASIAATARDVDRLAASTQNLRTSTNAVYNYGNAFKLMGGEASEALDAISRFEEFQNNLRLNGQDGSIDALAKAGIDVFALSSTRTGEEFMRALSDMLPSLDEGQRTQVQSTLGLSDYAMRAMSGGSDNLDILAAKAGQLTGPVDGLIDNSRKLQESASELSLTIEGIRNELADKFLPSLIGASNWFNKLIGDNREGISRVIDYAAENDGATSLTGLSAGSVVAGAAASKLGLAGMGGAASSAGTLGVATVAGSIGAHELSKYLDSKLPGYGQAAREFDDWIKSITGLETIKSPIQLINDVFAPGDGLSDPQARAYGDMTVQDSMPASDSASREQDRQADADAFAGALSRTPLKVNNQLGITLELDGQVLDSRIMQVNERQNYETLGDLTTSTER
ncbi:hypothetical protein ACX3X6_08700 [Pseudomonas sichuanensis]